MDANHFDKMRQQLIDRIHTALASGDAKSIEALKEYICHILAAVNVNVRMYSHSGDIHLQRSSLINCVLGTLGRDKSAGAAGMLMWFKADVLRA